MLRFCRSIYIIFNRIRYFVSLLLIHTLSFATPWRTSKPTKVRAPGMDFNYSAVMRSSNSHYRTNVDIGKL
jgi:hypothetical protein